MKYVVPKSYVELYSGHVPPSDDGMTGPGDKGDGKLHGEDALFKELFNSEDNAEAEEEDQHFSVEVTHVPDGKDLELLDDFEEELDYEPSEVGNSDDPGGDGAHPSQNTVMIDGDCQPPEMTCLMFSVGLTNNQAATVKRGLQDVVLYLQLHGFPVFRFHADKGEFYNHQLRGWLRDQGIFGTWSEPGVPQSNGHAESSVKWVKDSIRTYLQGASLPVRLWPTAAEAACAAQRAKVLGWRTYLAAPYGSVVHLRKKAFDKTGPLKREQTLESKWHKGRYVGLSTILNHGHLVYVPPTADEKEKFSTRCM